MPSNCNDRFIKYDLLWEWPALFHFKWKDLLGKFPNLFENIYIYIMGITGDEVNIREICIKVQWYDIEKLTFDVSDISIWK